MVIDAENKSSARYGDEIEIKTFESCIYRFNY
jgi:hypothetical protein